TLSHPYTPNQNTDITCLFAKCIATYKTASPQAQPLADTHWKLRSPNQPLTSTTSPVVLFLGLQLNT
uniref:hypothetical protein n=1 Tax=Candidatus Enterovibrio escicola TaxID=1927127 RepID=UPI001CC2FDD3